MNERLEHGEKKLLTPVSECDIRTGEANVSLIRSVGSSSDLSPKEKRKVRLQIANPLPGGNSIISLYHAERYVRRGDAYLDGNGKLVFVSQPENRLISAETQLLRRTGRGYDLATAIGMVKECDMKQIPIALASKAMGRGKNTGGRAPGARPDPLTVRAW